MLRHDITNLSLATIIGRNHWYLSTRPWFVSTAPLAREHRGNDRGDRT